MSKKRYWLWVKARGGRTASGYGFDTKKDAEAYWKRHWHGERSVTHKITYE